MTATSIPGCWNVIYRSVLDSPAPMAITKIGSTESKYVSHYLQKNYDKLQDRKHLWRNSGVFCKDDHSFYRWCDAYISGIRSSDYVHLWQEFCFMSSYQPALIATCLQGLTDSYLLKALNPPLKHYPVSCPHELWLPFFLEEKGWHYALQHKKVLVITAAKHTFEHQAKLYDKIWPGAKLGGFSFVQVPHSELLTGENLDNPLDWQDKVKLVQAEITKHDFDFALVGCGGIGLIIIDFIKNQLGKSCAYLGGNLQLVFGIKGNRWENANLPGYAANEYWIKPFLEDTPKNFMQLDCGAYW